MLAQKRQAPLPGSVQDFDKRRAMFEAWLLERGSAIKQVTNPYEVIRFMGADAECIVCRKASGTISHWANGAMEAYRAFLDGTPWRASARGKRDPKRINLVLSLARRDGCACVFCGKPTEIETVTVEHFVPVTAGSTSHMADLSLAHKECNAATSRLSAREKVEMAVRNRCAPGRNAEHRPAGAACLDPAS